MRVRLTVNIGTNAARELGLSSTREGAEVDVPEDAAAFMLRKGWAAAIDVPEAGMPEEIHAVPPVEIAAEADEPTDRDADEPESDDDDGLGVGDDADDESAEIDDEAGESGSADQPRRRRGRPRKDGR